MINACNRTILSIGNSIFIDIFCWFLLFACPIFCFLIYKKTFFKKKALLKKTTLFISSVFLTSFLTVIIINLFHQGVCAEELNSNDFLFEKNEIKDITMNRVVVIGDSRMEYIEEDSTIDIPANMSFIAKSAMKISWFEETAIPLLEEKILNNKEYTYHVVINMGVNDLNDTTDSEKIAKLYFKLYQRLSNKYNDTKFYILSINPVDDTIINKYWDDNIRSNVTINTTNKLLKKFSTNSNIKYCDSYNELEFDTKDGLHYTRSTNQKIINYIASKCISY